MKKTEKTCVCVCVYGEKKEKKKRSSKSFGLLLNRKAFISIRRVTDAARGEGVSRDNATLITTYDPFTINADFRCAGQTGPGLRPYLRRVFSSENRVVSFGRHVAICPRLNRK